MADFRLPPLNDGERLYRALLHLYPARFRRAFGQELVEAFRDQRRDARGRDQRASAFWAGVLRDLVTQAAAERCASLWRAAHSIRGINDEDSIMTALPQALRPLELRLAVRRLARAPSFTVTTIVVLALGIGATTAVFSVVNGVLLRPLPYASPDRLVALGHTVQVGGVSSVQQSDGTLLLYQRHASAFDGIAGWRYVGANVAPGASAANAERVDGAAVTANFFDMLGVRQGVGRVFRENEDRPGAAPVVVLSNAFWQSRFRGDSSAIGTRIVVDGISREIVGVMPRGFAFPSAATRLWLPVAFDPAHTADGNFNYSGIGRLRAGVMPEAARADLERILPRLLEEYPNPIPREMWEGAHVRPTVVPLRDSLVGEVSGLLWILLGSVSLVLVIACANVANLFLVRGEARSLEHAVRGALGSGIAGIVAQCLSEAIMLSLAGGIIGVALAAVGIKVVADVGGSLGLPRVSELSVDIRVLSFAFGIIALCALFISLLPMLRARRTPIASVLRAAGRGSISGGTHQRARSVLVVAQVALALVLVAASGLLARSFSRLRSVRPGFDASGVVVARLFAPEATYRTPASVVRLYADILERVRAIPGVRDATITNWVPLTDDHDDTVMGVEDHPLPPNGVPRVHFFINAGADYFRTMRIPLLAGRTIDAHDPTAPAREVVVSRAFAERYWPGGSPLGKRIRPGLDSEWYTIVGEASDVHLDALDKPVNDAVYFPLVMGGSGAPDVARYAALLVRGSRSEIASAVRNAVHAVDPTLPTFDERSLDAVVSAASARARMTLALLAAASMIALLLGAVGLYGVMAYGVSLRQREIGVRLALGAQPSDVRRMISRGGLGLAAIGVVIGTACALGVTRLLRGLLYDISPTDPLTLGATSVVLLAMAFLASWIPARRASSLDPVEALRDG